MNYNEDIRVDVNLHDKPKFISLRTALGVGAMHYLVCLWCNAARQCPDGNLKGWTPVAIAHVAEYSDDPDKLVDALLAYRWLDKTEDGYRIHDWAEHQPYAVGAPERVEKARKAGLASAAKRAKSLTKPTKIQLKSNESLTSSQRLVNKTPTLCQPPSPSPSPSLNRSNVVGKRTVKPLKKPAPATNLDEKAGAAALFQMAKGFLNRDLTPAEQQEVESWLAANPRSWVEEAFREAARSGGHTLKYVQKIMTRLTQARHEQAQEAVEEEERTREWERTP